MKDLPMRTLTVELADRAYPIHIGEGLLVRAGELLAPLGVARAIIVTNATVAAHWLASLREGLLAGRVATETILIPDGEAHKNQATLNDLVTRLIELRAERSTVLVALGGGVAGDIAGFAAAIFQRGMPFVQVPTTLLAQVDSSVGGKTGINHPLGKNLIGAFHQPLAVLADTRCLATLPVRELSAGLAEVIKSAAIRDASFFDWLEDNVPRLLAGDAAALAHAIEQSCRIKAGVVAADERETGQERALLNFGHTFGHAIETGAGYGAWLHGEAVAAGMVIATRVSQRVCGLARDEGERLARLIAAARLPVTPPAMPLPQWLALMGRDKKVKSGAVRYVLLERLGRAVIRADVPEADVAAAIAG
jgi:3-dehydroquinate synthase